MAQALSVTLTSPQTNGFNIACFGLKTGSINATVTGGTPPYSYSWSTGATTQNLSNRPAGYYKLTVVDADSTVVIREITLTDPTYLGAAAVAPKYPNNYHVSCYDCFNGSINLTVTGGVAPYSYLWSDGATTKDRSGLGALSYSVVVTDANGCQRTSESIVMTQPPRDTWNMGGNSGTNPATHFMGTADSADLVFKSNGLNLLRLTGDGTVKLLGAGQGAGLLYRLPDGTLRGGGTPVYPSLPPSLCYETLEGRPYWETRGNDFSELCEGGEQPMLGTLNPMPLHLITSGQERMVITTNGKVGIGTATPGSKLQVHGDLLVRDGAHGDIVTSSSSATGPVLWARNTQAAWGLSVDASGRGHILGDWNDPQSRMTFTYGGVGIGTTDPDAKLHVYGDLLVQGEGWHGEMVTSSSASTGPVIWARNYVGALGLSIDPDGNGRILKHWGDPTTMMTFKNDEVSIPNRLVIGDVEPKSGYQLFVQDGILTEKVKVALKTSSEWSDHVFKSGYRLMPLTDVARFIREYGHLPGVPSADQMVEQGLDVVKTDAMLLEKIEEITLHLIGMEKRMTELEAENAALRRAMTTHDQRQR